MVNLKKIRLLFLAGLLAIVSCGLVVAQSLEYGVTYIDKTGKIVVKLNSDVVNAGDFHDGLAKIIVGKKWGYIDRSGQRVIPPQFDNANDFFEGLARIGMGDTYLGKSKYIDKTGKVVIEPNLYDVSYFSNFHEGLTAVQNIGRKKGEWQPLEKRQDGYIDKTGKVVIKGYFSTESPFSEGMARVGLNGADASTGFIDKKGKVVIKGNFMAGYFSEGLVNVTIDDKYGYIDKTGKIVIKPQFRGAYYFHEGLANVSVGLNEKGYNREGFIDKTGKIVVPPQFYRVNRFSQGLAAVLNYQGKWGYIDKTGNYIIQPKFEEASDFSEGLAKITIGSGFCQAKSGYIDKTGNYVIVPQFYGASDFSEGLALVWRGSSLACMQQLMKVLSQM